MNISEKIEAIRREPDHIRLRWVWGSVAFSMIFIVGIWIVSMTFLFQEEKDSSSQSATNGQQDITKQLQELKKQAPSLKDFSDTSLKISNEGISATPNATTNSQNPDLTTDTISDAPENNAYSNLSTENLQ